MPTPVELVETTAADGVVLNGAFATGAASASPLPFDAVLMMHGQSATFYEPFFRGFSDALLARGYATLRANNRGHDIINRADRTGRLLGVAFERIEECVLDWRAWSDFLGARGCERILVWGHSLGAVKTAWYLAHEKDARVGACILASPPRFNEAAFLASDRSADYAANLARARAVIATGASDLLFRTTYPTQSVMDPHAYLEKYAAGARYDVLELVGRIPCPVLALTGERELGEATFADHPTGYAAAQKTKPDLEHVVVPNGDHFYGKAQPFVIDRVHGWLERQFAVRPAVS